MALDHAALLEVLDVLKAGEAGERVRVAAETMYQALIETELTATIGAQPWERSRARTNQRNGSQPRTLSTTAGDLQLRMPKLRTGSFYPAPLADQVAAFLGRRGGSGGRRVGVRGRGCLRCRAGPIRWSATARPLPSPSRGSTSDSI